MIKTAQLLGLFDAMEKSAAPFLKTLETLKNMAAKAGTTRTTVAKHLASAYDSSMQQLNRIAGKMRARGIAEDVIQQKLLPFAESRAAKLHEQFNSIAGNASGKGMNKLLATPVNPQRELRLGSFIRHPRDAGFEMFAASDGIAPASFGQSGLVKGMRANNLKKWNSKPANPKAGLKMVDEVADNVILKNKATTGLDDVAKNINQRADAMVNDVRRAGQAAGQAVDNTGRNLLIGGGALAGAGLGAYGLSQLHSNQ